MKPQRPVMLVILDGWGWRDDPADNAVRQARTPVFDELWSSYPHAFLRASGLEVGLPAGQMGNSEVGHLNIGAGRVVMQDLPRISDATRSGDIARNPTLLRLVEQLRKSGGTCHLMGLVSPGGVHAHQDHAASLAHVLAKAGVPTVVHVITDGRDTPPRSAKEFVTALSAALPASAPIVSVSGRYFAMDRDNRWDRVAKAYGAIVEAAGPRFASPLAVIEDGYAHDKSDEFLEPAVVGDYAGMKDGDALLCFNFRADRVREILAAALDPQFKGFARPRLVKFCMAVGLTSYSADLNRFMSTMFEPQSMANVLGEVAANASRRQLRMAETEKYAHVTYFLNGGAEAAYAGEDRIMVPSPKVATYDLQPEMSAPELTDKAVGAIASGTYDLIVLNYANPDMVGHTGDLAAAVKAVETVDTGLGRLWAAIRAAGGALVVIADHGNCELMRDPQTGGPHTAHTTNPVPALLIGTPNTAIADGKLADVAPTLLQLMGLTQPAEMTGKSLLRG
ncbi:MAG: 2,3-bisphosphoglycerate-independent phosphoglycerate mutase [Hyphomicrobiaceae bacterium]